MELGTDLRNSASVLGARISKVLLIGVAAMATAVPFGQCAQAQQAAQTTAAATAPAAPAPAWLPSLKTETPQAGYDLAIKLSRVAVRVTQPDAAKRQRGRDLYEMDPAALIHVSHVVAVNFATIAAANNYWK